MNESTTLQGLYNSSERTLGWHRLPGSQKFSGKPGTTISQAFAEMHMDFSVRTEPMFIEINGTKLAVPGRNAIVKENGGIEVFGSTGANYVPLQNAQVAALLDPLTAKWGLDTIVSSNHGRDTMIALKTEEAQVNGEAIQEYFWFFTSHNGESAVRAMLVPVRLFCTNQLLSAIRGASFSAKVQHLSGVDQNVKFEIDIFKLMEEARRVLHQSFTEMGKKRLSPEEITALFEQVYPEPKLPRRLQQFHTLAAATATAEGGLDEAFRNTITQDQLSAVGEAEATYEGKMQLCRALRRDAATLLERFNDEHTKLANTAWAVYNAGVELADFRGHVKYSVAAAQSALIGDRAKEKEELFTGCMSLVNPAWEKEAASQGNAARQQAIEAARDLARAAAGTGTRAPRTGSSLLAREEARLARLVAKQPVRKDEEGNVLPPLTAEELYEQRVAEERAAIEKLENELKRRREEQEARVQAVAARLQARKDEAIKRIEARKLALGIRASAESILAGDEAGSNGTVPENEPLEVGDLVSDSEPNPEASATHSRK